jgi:ComF family protein
MPVWMDAGLARLGGLLLPPRCVLCGDRGQPPCLDLCRACEAALPAAREPLITGPGPLRRCLAPFDYGFPLAHLVQGLKYRGELATGRVLGTLLGERIAALGVQSDVDVVLPVPLHPLRHGDRGFNQSAEIGRWVGRRLGLRLDPQLALRRRDTPPQVGLTVEQRRRNLAGAFAAAPGVRGLRVAVLDDVTTTGRTLHELAGALLEAGAAAVDGWCVARADRRGASPAGACNGPVAARRHSTPDRSAILPRVAEHGRTRGPGAAAAALPSRCSGQLP